MDANTDFPKKNKKKYFNISAESFTYTYLATRSLQLFNPCHAEPGYTLHLQTV